MELKCYNKIVIIFAFESSNCTFMELKYVTKYKVNHKQLF